MRTKAASVALVAAIALLGAGCGGDSPADEPAGTTAPSAPAGTATPAAPAAFNDDRASGTFDCGGQDVTVNSEQADLHLIGECGTVVINGDRSQVLVDDAVLIVVNGEDAQVRYAGKPRVTVNGEGATAEPA